MFTARGGLVLCLLLLPDISSAQTRVQHPVARAPLTFEENRGQADPRVRFLARGKGYTLFLTDETAVFDLASNDRSGAAIRMTLDGALAPRRISGVDPLPGRSHYFRGSDARRWTTGIPTYGKVRYESVYRGIDLVYYGNEQQLEYDFVVAPGASPSTIRVRFSGVRDLRVAPNGDLMMRAGDRELRQPKPLVFQQVNGKREIAAGYVLLPDGAVGFDIGAYDRSLPLTIDPVLIYSTLWGEQFGDVWDIASDTSGNAYVVGTSMSATFPTTFGAWRRIPDGENPDVFVTKFDPTGAVVYSTYLGGHGIGSIRSIAVDRFGAAYVGGETTAVDFPTTAGAFQNTCVQHPPQVPAAGRCGAAFVTKLDPSGSRLVFSTYLGGAGVAVNGYPTVVEDLAIDESLNLFVGGGTGPAFPVTPGAFQPEYRAWGFTGFVAKMNASGTALIYASYLGGEFEDVVRGIAVDGAGNAYVAGELRSADFPTTAAAFQRSCRIVNIQVPGFPEGCLIAFVSKINSTGTSLVYSTFLGGQGPTLAGVDGLSSEAHGIAVDSEGHAYVTGTAYAADFPTTPGSLKETTASRDVFVSKMNLDGTGLIYSTLLGGQTGDELGGAIAIDALGNAYVTGTTLSSAFPTVAPVQPAHGGGSFDAFVSVLNPAGSALTFSTYLGGEGEEQPTSIAADSAGQIHVAGTIRFSVAGFPIVNPARPAFEGTFTSFVSKIGEPSCGTEMTGQLDVLQSPFFTLVVPFSLQFAVVWNRSASPVTGPIAYVMHDMQNGIYLGPQRTRCFSAEGDQLTTVSLGGETALAPSQAALMVLVFFQTPGAAISYTPRLLSGPRNR